jgi:hypothetical protein
MMWRLLRRSELDGGFRLGFGTGLGGKMEDGDEVEGFT